MVNILDNTFLTASREELKELADDILKFNGYKKPKEHKDWRRKTMYEMQYKSLRNNIVELLENIEWLHNMSSIEYDMVYKYMIFKSGGKLM